MAIVRLNSYLSYIRKCKSGRYLLQIPGRDLGRRTNLFVQVVFKNVHPGFQAKAWLFGQSYPSLFRLGRVPIAHRNVAREIEAKLEAQRALALALHLTHNSLRQANQVPKWLRRVAQALICDGRGYYVPRPALVLLTSWRGSGDKPRRCRIAVRPAA